MENRMWETAQPGQIWALNSDVRMNGLIVWANPDDFAFWPVTPFTGTAEEGSLIAPRSGHDGADLLLWPTIETGCTTAVLSHSVTTVLTPEQMHELRQAVLRDAPLTQPWSWGTHPGGRTREALILATHVLEPY